MVQIFPDCGEQNDDKQEKHVAGKNMFSLSSAQRLCLSDSASRGGRERTLLWILENNSAGIQYGASDTDISEEHYKAPSHL